MIPWWNGVCCAYISHVYIFLPLPGNVLLVMSIQLVSLYILSFSLVTSKGFYTLNQVHYLDSLFAKSGCCSVFSWEDSLATVQFFCWQMLFSSLLCWICYAVQMVGCHSIGYSFPTLSTSLALSSVGMETVMPLQPMSSQMVVLRLGKAGNLVNYFLWSHDG